MCPCVCDRLLGEDEVTEQGTALEVDANMLSPQAQVSRGDEWTCAGETTPSSHPLPRALNSPPPLCHMIEVILIFR